ncbi:MAG TPA: hypothetical protein VK638_17795 [Edaphobacter sp.]|nr:hypothetical protein [Edaphobacter sp.]
MTRRPDWQERLSRFLGVYARRPFRYGEWDCCLFVCDAVLEMTGTDLAADFRGAYASRETAYAAICKATGKRSVRAVAELVTRRAGMPQVPILYARRGDVVLIQRKTDCSLGLLSLTGKEIIVLRSRILCKLPISHGLLAWHV